MSEMLHHMVINIKGNDVSTGRKLGNYKGPGNFEIINFIICYN